MELDAKRFIGISEMERNSTRKVRYRMMERAS